MTAPSEGRHAITAVYEGQGSFLPATSGEVLLTTGPAVGPFAIEVPSMTVAVGVPARAGAPAEPVADVRLDRIQSARELDRIDSTRVEFEPIEWTANRRQHPIRATKIDDWQRPHLTSIDRGGGARSAASTRLFRSEGSS